MGAVVIAGCGQDESRSVPSKDEAPRAIVPAGQSAAPVEPRPAPAQPPFLECAEPTGLRFTWQSGHRERYLNPEITGGGVGLIDYDGDGDLDVYCLQGGSADDTRPHSTENHVVDRLFRNDLGTDGDSALRFVDVTDEVGLGDARYGMGAAVGDYDNDGDSDLYVTNLGRNTLYRNDGGRFVDVTAKAGVGDEGWGSSAGFFDLEGDGDLDLYVCNYIHWSTGTERECQDQQGRPDYCSPSAYRAPSQDRLYRNRGDGTFEDATVELGIDSAIGNSLGVSFGDFDGDGVLDIFVANDGMMNHLWTRPKDGPFRDRALERGVATDGSGQVKAGMGVGNADLDGDGDLDLLVVNLNRETDSFFRNDGAYFSDRTAAVKLAPISRAFTRFGTGFADFDNDGQLDLYQSNGRVQRGPVRERAPGDDPYAEPNLLYRRVGGAAGASGTEGKGEPGFVEWLPRGGTVPEIVRTSRGAAFGDLDNDGGIDLVVVNRDQPLSLLRNQVQGRGNWVTLRVLERTGGDALGAEVRVRVGDRWVRRDVMTAYSYCASNDPRVHIGLGQAERVEEVEVRWTDGSVDRFGALPVNQIATLRRPAGAVEPPG